MVTWSVSLQEEKEEEAKKNQKKASDKIEASSLVSDLAWLASIAFSLPGSTPGSGVLDRRLGREGLRFDVSYVCSISLSLSPSFFPILLLTSDSSRSLLPCSSLIIPSGPRTSEQVTISMYCRVRNTRYELLCFER
jgi:hypothetical protein